MFYTNKNLKVMPETNTAKGITLFMHREAI